MTLARTRAEEAKWREVAMGDNSIKTDVELRDKGQGSGGKG